jgi:ABC-2 type transport system ATP-binding protein
MSIIASNVTKTYGTQKALDDVSFTIPAGEIVGFIGPNGAGKSTMMKIITGFFPADSGTVTVCGLPAGPDAREMRRLLGYLPENNPLYVDMYVREYLEYVADIYSLGKRRKEAVDSVVERTGLTPEQGKKIGALSKGYRQRVGLAQALIHDPQVLILDEATTGLDPNQIVEIRNLISEAGREKTVMLSTHIMQEVEAICNRVIIIDHGRIVADGPIDEISSLAGARLEETFRHLTGGER